MAGLYIHWNDGVKAAMETQDLLNERGKTHGDAEAQFKTAQEIKRFFRAISSSFVANDPMVCEALDMIAVKLSRIMRGDPYFRDHWDDIAGYAKLVADRCSK